jgi:hypothetical protein
MLSTKQASVPNTYETPSLRKLEPEDAKQFLLHHAELGDPDAKELLALVLPQRLLGSLEFSRGSKEPPFQLMSS